MHSANSQEQTVYQYIERAIVENRMPPGTRLREFQLAEIFGVKRGLIRKVLSRLTSSKLVEHIPNAGAQVARPSLKDGQDLFSTRIILERAVIGMLCGHLTHEQIARLRDYIEQEKHAYQSGETQKALRLSAGFHRLLVELTGNRVLQEFMNEILNRTPLVLLSLADQPAAQGCVNHDHEDIVNALEQGDIADAQKHMQLHLLQLQEMFNHKQPQPSKDLAEIFQQP